VTWPWWLRYLRTIIKYDLYRLTHDIPPIDERCLDGSWHPAVSCPFRTKPGEMWCARHKPASTSEALAAIGLGYLNDLGAVPSRPDPGVPEKWGQDPPKGRF
jgi:hypothetical protein